VRLRDGLWLIGLGSCLVILLAAGCETAQPAAPVRPTALITPVVDTILPSDASAATADASPTITASNTLQRIEQPTDGTTPGASITLTLWTVEAVSPEAAGKAGEIFAQGIRSFASRYPNVTVVVKLKNETGKGSVLDYLRTASQVAPSVLPDVVVLDLTELAAAARAGVLFPLDKLIAPSLINDLLPGARAAGSVDGQLMGLPFEADFEHVVFSTEKLTAPPATWEDVLNAGTIYRFPAKGRNGLVNDCFLIQYLAAGGRLLDEEGQPTLDEAVLTSVLDYYLRGVRAGVIPLDVLEAASADDLWSWYTSNRNGIVHVRARKYIEERFQLRGSRFAAIPTREGKPLTLVRGRALAITARDASQQAVAARMIEWMLQPDNVVVWNQVTFSVPTRYATLNRWGSDPYLDFLRQQMEVALPVPSFSQYDQIGRVLQQAVLEVLSGDATPEEAAATAVSAITR
jgi:multiple sugar transport system substrate-binding protein